MADHRYRRLVPGVAAAALIGATVLGVGSGTARAQAQEPAQSGRMAQMQAQMTEMMGQQKQMMQEMQMMDEQLDKLAAGALADGGFPWDIVKG